MLEEEWLDHGPASLNLLLERQSERDKLLKLCAGTIAAVWVKDATPGTFFYDLKVDEDRAKKLTQIETVKATIKNAKRRRQLEGRGSKTTGAATPEPSRKG